MSCQQVAHQQEFEEVVAFRADSRHVDEVWAGLWGHCVELHKMTELGLKFGERCVDSARNE